MLGVLVVIAVVVAPAVFIGRRVRRLSRASQDRIADASALASEVLAAMPVVQSYAREDDEARRFSNSAETAFRTAVSRNKVRSLLTAFIIVAMFGALLYGLYLGTVSVMEGRMSAVFWGRRCSTSAWWPVRPPRSPKCLAIYCAPPAPLSA
jgi:ABC-type multidrug transport system, ATPase and permease components